MPSLKQLEIFLQVVEKGGFTNAAESLYMTQPTVSWQIKKLEEALGAELFKKRDRNLELSEAGEIVHRAAKEMLGVYQHMQNAIEDYKCLGNGSLTIGASSIPGEYLLPSLLAKFAKEHPNLKLQVQISGSLNAIRQLVAAKTDIAIVGAKTAVEGITYTPWLSDEIIAVTAFDNQQIPDKLTPQGLTEFVMVGRGVQSGTRIAIENEIRKHGLDLLGFPHYISINTTQGLLAAVAEGMGFAFVSRWAAAPMLAAKRLREVQVTGLKINREFYIASWRTTYPIPSVTTFTDFLLNATDELKGHALT